MNARSALVRFQFALRSGALGRVKLRSGLPEASGSADTPEARFYLLVLRAAFGRGLMPEITDLWDVGCRNWSYASALAAFFPRAVLHGIELDGGRRYWDLHRRIDAAQSEAEALAARGRSALVLEADFAAVYPPIVAPTSGQRDADMRISGERAISFFFPFVSPDPALAWGVPEEYARFSELLLHAQLWPRPLSIVSCHQGEWETEIARQAYAAAGLDIASERWIEPADYAGLWPSEHRLGVLTARVRSK